MPSQHKGKQSSLWMTPEENALWERLAKAHGGKKAAVLAGLRGLDRGAPEPTPEQALKVLGELVSRVPKQRQRG